MQGQPSRCWMRRPAVPGGGGLDHGCRVNARRHSGEPFAQLAPEGLRRLLSLRRAFPVLHGAAQTAGPCRWAAALQAFIHQLQAAANVARGRSARIKRAVEAPSRPYAICSLGVNTTTADRCRLVSRSGARNLVLAWVRVSGLPPTPRQQGPQGAQQVPNPPWARPDHPAVPAAKGGLVQRWQRRRQPDPFEGLETAAENLPCQVAQGCPPLPA